MQHVPRGTNQEADDIARRVSKRLPREPGVFEERLFKPLVAPPLSRTAQPREELPQPPATGAPACGPTSGARLLLALEPQEACWTTEFKDYLMQGILPENEEEAEHVARQATAYCIQDGELYRKRPNDVSLHCISREQGKELLADIHRGDCGHHSSSRTLVGKAFRSGFYWPTALSDAVELVKACEACQFHAKQIHQPAGGLPTIPSPGRSQFGGWTFWARSLGRQGAIATSTSSWTSSPSGPRWKLSAQSRQARQSSSSRAS